jgi:hypothetical protein
MRGDLADVDTVAVEGGNDERVDMGGRGEWESALWEGRCLDGQENRFRKGEGTINGFDCRALASVEVQADERQVRHFVPWPNVLMQKKVDRG